MNPATEPPLSNARLAIKAVANFGPIATVSEQSEHLIDFTQAPLTVLLTKYSKIHIKAVLRLIVAGINQQPIP